MRPTRGVPGLTTSGVASVDSIGRMPTTAPPRLGRDYPSFPLRSFRSQRLGKAGIIPLPEVNLLQWLTRYAE